MFEKSEVDAELHSRLKAAGLNPLDPNVRTITSIVSVYYAEQTSKVLKRVMDVIDGLTPETTNSWGRVVLYNKKNPGAGPGGRGRSSEESHQYLVMTGALPKPPNR